MFLPKPNVLEMPACSLPVGIGLEACNSGNYGTINGCDVHTPTSSGSSGGKSFLDFIQTLADVVSAAATAAG